MGRWTFDIAALSLAACLCLLALAGCGGGGPTKVALVPVKGKITVKGQAAEGASIMLTPVDVSGPLKLLRPRAQCDAQGQFVLETYETGDGAPPGEYKVTIKWRGPSLEFAGGMVPEAEKNSGPDRLQGKYENAETSGLKATVGSTATELPVFALP